MATHDYLRPITQRALGVAKTKRRNFVTIHTSIHSDLHEYLRQDAAEHDISLASMLEFIIANYYKERLKARDGVVSEIGDPDYADK